MLRTKTKIATTKIMVFSVGALFLGIRLEEVQKVMTMPNLHKGSNVFLGVTQVDNQEIVVLDLHQTIYGAVTASSNKGYLIVTRSSEQLYGLTSANLPTMVEIPLADLRLVPAEYRDRDTLGLAAQMAQVSLAKDQLSTLFLIDLACLTDLVKQYNADAMQQEYEALSALQFPIDVLDLPGLTTVDPPEADFRIDFS